VEEYWEPLLVLPLEQQRVAGREPPSERRSEGQPEYSEELRLLLHRHRAPITATQPTGMATQATDIPLIGILLTDIRATHHRTTDTQDIRDTPLILVPQAMDTQATRDTPTTPVLRVLDIRATQGIPLILVPQAMDTQATWDIPTTPVLRVMNTQATRDTPLILVLQTTDTQARRGIQAIRHLSTRAARHTPPYPGPGYGYPMHGCPGDRASEDWSPGVDYAIEPSG
jgi:hypothetical protein